jgi:hypothetical protein
MHEESTIGSSTRWLTSGERSVAAYLIDGEKWRKRKKEASAAGFL